MSATSIQTIIAELEESKTRIRQDTKLDTEKRERLLNGAVALQLRAAALDLSYKKIVARLPENGALSMPLLPSSKDGATKPSTQ